MKTGKKTGQEAENKGGYFSDLHYLHRSNTVDNEYKGAKGMDAPGYMRPSDVVRDFSTALHCVPFRSK